MKKGEECKQRSAFVLRGAFTEAAHALGSSGPLSCFPGVTLSVSASSPHNWELCEHLCFISINFVHPLATCVLKLLLLYFTPLPSQFTKGFIEHSSLGYSGENVHLAGCMHGNKSFAKRGRSGSNYFGYHCYSGRTRDSVHGLQLSVGSCVSFSPGYLQV